MGIVFVHGSAHGVGAHFHGGRDLGHRNPYSGDTLGGGVDVGPDYGNDESPPAAPIYVAPPQIVQYIPIAPPQLSDGPRIIVLDHRMSRKSRGRLPLVIYGDPAS
jgi:hypothetical protein